MPLPIERHGAGVAPGRSGKTLILAAVAVVLAGGGFVAYRKLQAPPEPAQPTQPVVVVDPGIVEFEPFVLNLADPAGNRYFRLNLRLVLDQKHIAQRASTHAANVKLRDRVLSLLSKKQARDMAALDGKEALRVEIGTVTEALFATPPFYDPVLDPAPARVIDVLFTEFLVQ